MGATFVGTVSWEATRDEMTYRDYNITSLVRTDFPEDGPAIVMQCPGLPQMGAIWAMGNDLDVWAWCHPDMKVRLQDQKPGEKGKFWLVDQKFSTKPIQRCMDTQVTNPIQEPQKISGSFVKYTQEYRYDRYGNFVTNSALEPIRGPDSEFDANRPTVRIEQNVMSLNLPSITGMIDTVNLYPIWGLSPRCVKLSDIQWERKVQGTCQFYFTRIFNFDINPNTFDRTVADFGSMVLRGKWNTSTGVYNVTSGMDRTNPQNFMRYQDIAGNPSSVVLNGYGLPAGTTLTVGTGTSSSASGPEGQILIEHYPGSDFTLLGVPTDLSQSQ